MGSAHDVTAGSACEVRRGEVDDIISQRQAKAPPWFMSLLSQQRETQHNNSVIVCEDAGMKYNGRDGEGVLLCDY